jgi:ribosome biogenesis GTPase
MNDDLTLPALLALGLHAFDLPHRACPPTPDLQPMRVVAVQRDHVLLHDGQHSQRGRVGTALAHQLAADEDALAVGDWVWADAPAAGGPTVRACWPRRNALVRSTQAEHGGLQRQVLVSNLDTALLLMALDHDFNLRRLERYLGLVQLAGVPAVLLLTKADTVGPDIVAQRLAQARTVLPPAMPALAVDTRTDAVAAALAPWLGHGQTLVLLGSSGAGKSTLTNRLCADDRPGADSQRTGAVRQGDDRGRHTTTVRSLHRTAQGACLIDTPGLRALRLAVADSGALAEAFGDVARWASQCRFRDCRHGDEPGCAVRAAVPEDRLRNYQKLLREARRDSLTILERHGQRAQWRARGRSGQQRALAKRGG